MDLGIPNGTLGGSPDGELWYSWACLGQQAITYEAGGAQPRQIQKPQTRMSQNKRKNDGDGLDLEEENATTISSHST